MSQDSQAELPIESLLHEDLFSDAYSTEDQAGTGSRSGDVLAGSRPVICPAVTQPGSRVKCEDEESLILEGSKTSSSRQVRTPEAPASAKC